MTVLGECGGGGAGEVGEEAEGSEPDYDSGDGLVDE